MGKLEVRGTASRKVNYDLMKITLEFHAKEDTAQEASKKVMRDCEDFLEILKKGGMDISKIALSRDSVDQCTSYENNRERECYRAIRTLELESGFNMKMINDIRSIINNSGAQVDFKVDFNLSNESEIRQELMADALVESRKQAEIMAEAIGQNVVGLISADRTGQRKDGDIRNDSLLGAFYCEQFEGDYDNSDELSSTSETYTEVIFATWEIE
ncbi:SIMPL domain-containing protein [Ruminococcus sp.]|uniref:SIMPL domain-containing protein n=1 Tax=Ruminococcus sp. TaxID=41978 RepID=UPI00258B36B2|nr:SIMPL domain-containing protein [Ruminococcus sp.]MCR5021918.1 SIMPL domain-containing protein [Ruminococcus sp.]